MTPRSTSREEAIIGIAAFITENGLSNTSLRTLADAIGTSDRMLLYYFKDKTDIITTVLQYLANDMTEVLADVIPMGARLSPEAIFTKVVAFTQTEELRPYMALGLEIAAKAQSGQAPYPDVAKGITQGFITWLDDRLQVANLDMRRTQAVMLLAMIDGLYQVSLSTDDATFEKARNSMAMALRRLG